MKGQGENITRSEYLVELVAEHSNKQLQRLPAE